MLTFTVDWTGTPDAADLAAAKRIVANENSRRAALEPPGTPLAFEGANNATKAASYKTALAYIVSQAHASYIQQANETTHAERKAAYDAANQSTKDQIDTLLGL